MGFKSSYARTANNSLLEMWRPLRPTTARWTKAVTTFLGSYSDDSVIIADAIVRDLEQAGLLGKFVYLLPLLGAGRDNLRTAFSPLIDTLGVGTPTNAGPFVAADQKESTGLQGNGAKYMDTLIKPSQLGTSNNGGMGYWELAIDFTGGTTEVCGCYGAGGINRYVLDLRSGLRFFSWGNVGNRTNGGAAANGHYYGERSSATLRRLYIDGATDSSNTTSDSATGASDANIHVLDVNGSRNKGRCGLFYLTDGTLGDAGAATVDAIFRERLMKTARRIPGRNMITYADGSHAQSSKW